MASSFLNFLNLTGRSVASGTVIDAKTKKSQGGDSVIFPSDLFTPGNEAHILFIKRDPTTEGSISKDTKTAARLGLYMPPQIKVNYGSQWEELQMTVYQYADFGKELFDIAKNVVSKDGSDQSKAIGTLLSRGAANVLDAATAGANFGAQLEQYTKKTRNPHMALLFKGVNFRQFQFDFQMMARNEKETDDIKEIIRSFKAGMHPQVEDGSGRYWVYPDNFDIYLATGVKDSGGNQTSPYLFQISTAVLTDMSVDYAGSGIPSFFHTNGAPVDVRMSLSFKELGILTREKVWEGY